MQAKAPPLQGVTTPQTEEATKLVNHCLQVGSKIDLQTIQDQVEITENQLKWIIKKCKKAQKSAARSAE
ncbi:hypothetical protein OAN21_02740 [Alphaproteobacteria bacterium]|nr:hypothetical protein [Alphaproteobacteria bacterium]